jgi:hypothetical protein
MDIIGLGEQLRKNSLTTCADKFVNPPWLKKTVDHVLNAIRDRASAGFNTVRIPLATIREVINSDNTSDVSYECSRFVTDYIELVLEQKGMEIKTFLTAYLHITWNHASKDLIEKIESYNGTVGPDITFSEEMSYLSWQVIRDKYQNLEMTITIVEGIAHLLKEVSLAGMHRLTIEKNKLIPPFSPIDDETKAQIFKFIKIYFSMGQILVDLHAANGRCVDIVWNQVGDKLFEHGHKFVTKLRS